MRKPIILLLGLTLIASSCQYLFERIVNQRPEDHEFKYHVEKQDNINKHLKTEGFYRNADPAGNKVYLAFKPDNIVIYYTGTSITADTVYKYKGIYNPKRKRNGRPRDLSDDFGYYITKGDSLFVSVNKMGTLGSDKMHEFKGRIYPDSLVLHWLQLEEEYSSAYDFGVIRFVQYSPN